MSSSDLVREFMENFDLLEDLRIPPYCDPLSGLPPAIEIDFQERVGFDYDSQYSDGSEKTENIMRKAFDKLLSPYIDTKDSKVNLFKLAELLQDVTHHKVKRITNFNNKTLEEKYKKMSRTLDIFPNNTLFFHGTTRDNADSIVRSGFDKKKLKEGRDLWGIGFYLTELINLSMLYANPVAADSTEGFSAGNLTQSIVVSYVLRGRTEVGSQGKKDYGFTHSGEKITSLTDTRETLLVVPEEDQILPIAVIEIEYQPDREYTPEIKRRMGNFHPYIDQLIQQKLAAQSLGGTSFVPSQSAATGAQKKTETILPCYYGFKNGCKVRLNHITVAPELNGKTGVIQLIVQFHHGTRIYITVDNEDSLVQKINRNRRVYNAKTVPVEPHWLLCLPCQLTLC